MSHVIDRTIAFGTVKTLEKYQYSHHRFDENVKYYLINAHANQIIFGTCEINCDTLIVEKKVMNRFFFLRFTFFRSITIFLHSILEDIRI